ncbi:hypothetical protein M8C21_004573, partial [Ambrosia artemisiifolia]
MHQKMGYCISGSLTSLPASNPTHNKSLNFSKYTLSASIQRNHIPLHAGFGLSVDGKIDTAFTRKCSNCSLPYCRQITTNFNVWVLPSNKDGDSNQLPEIGGDDPSVIYVKPGCEADLDSLIQDTVRLTTSVNETCSDACEKSELGLKHISKAKAPTVDKSSAEDLCEAQKLIRVSITSNFKNRRILSVVYVFSGCNVVICINLRRLAPFILFTSIYLHNIQTINYTKQKRNMTFKQLLERRMTSPEDKKESMAIPEGKEIDGNNLIL